MKRTIIIWAFVSLFLVSVVFALPMCEDSPEIKSNCSMITPSIGCSLYNYSIFNTTGARLEFGNLTLLNDSVYYFNFTLEEGEYVVKLCDGAVREVVVKPMEDNNMIIGMIILLPMILGLFMMMGAWSLDAKVHAPLRIFLFLLSTVTFWVSMHFGLLSLIQFFNFTALEDMIASTIFWSGWVFAIIIIYFIIYLIYILFKGMSKAKYEEIEY